MASLSIFFQASHPLSAIWRADMRAKMSKYLFASGATHFRDIIYSMNGTDSTRNVHYYLEGQKRDTREKKAFVEFRMDGPDEKQSSGETTFEFVYNLMIQVSMDTQYMYLHHDIAGIIAKGFWNLLPIRNYGEEEVHILDCAKLIEDHKGRSVRIYHLGQVEPHTHIQRSAVMGRYELALTKSVLNAID
jgi:hypothetical protein